MVETKPPLLIKPTNMINLWANSEYDNLINVGIVIALSIVFIYCCVNIFNYIREYRTMHKELKPLKGVALSHILVNLLFGIIAASGIAICAYSLYSGTRVEIVISILINLIK